LVAGETLRLEQPLALSRDRGGFATPGLAMVFGPGRIGGSLGLRGQSLTMKLSVERLPLAPAARLLGHPGLGGTLDLAATVGGTLSAPRGHLTTAVHGLGFAQQVAGEPRLGLSLTSDWDGRRLALDGRLSGLGGDHIRFGGSLPLLLTRSPLGVGVPRDGRLALDFGGEGEIGRLVDSCRSARTD
jgi:hypothetical protein